MSACNQNCNQGRDCNCGLKELREDQDKMNKYLKWLLLFTALYFLGHIASALAQTYPTVPAPIIQCWSNGMGTIQCVQI